MVVVARVGYAHALDRSASSSEYFIPPLQRESIRFLARYIFDEFPPPPNTRDAAFFPMMMNAGPFSHFHLATSPHVDDVVAAWMISMSRVFVSQQSVKKGTAEVCTTPPREHSLATTSLPGTFQYLVGRSAVSEGQHDCHVVV